MKEEKKIQKLSDQELATAVGGGLSTGPSEQFSCSKLNKAQCETYISRCTWSSVSGVEHCVTVESSQPTGSGRDSAFVA